MAQHRTNYMLNGAVMMKGIEQICLHLLRFAAKKVINEGVPKLASARLDDVVDCYEHAALAMFPRARYMPGRDARLLFWPLTLLPEWVSDFIIMADPNTPVPAACK